MEFQLPRIFGKSIWVLITLIVIYNGPIEAQTWSFTNGPYADCGLSILVGADGSVIYNTCAGVEESTPPYLVWKTTQYFTATELSALNDGSHALLLDGGWVYSTVNQELGIPTSNKIYSATWTRDSVLLGAIDRTGILRTRDRGNTFDTANVGLVNYLTPRLLRADTAGYVFLTTKLGQVYRSTNDGDSWTQVLLAPDSIQTLYLSPTNEIFVASDSLCWHSTDHGLSFIPFRVGASFGNVVGFAELGITVVAVTSNRGIQYSTDLLHWTSWNTGIDSVDISCFVFTRGSGGALATSFSSGLFGADTVGSIWKKVPTSSKPTDVVGFAAPDQSTLYAATRAHGVYATEDHGNSWTRLWYQPSESIRSIAAFGSELVIGTQQGIHHSSDRGTNWDSVRLPGGGYVNSLIVDKAGIFYVVVSQAYLSLVYAFYRSIDGGSHWEPMAKIPNDYPYADIEADSVGQLLFFEEDQSGLVTSNPELWKSRDAGNTWTRTEMPFFVSYTALWSAAPDGFFYAEANTALYRTDDTSYASWSQCYTPRGNIDFSSFAYRSGTDIYGTQYENTLFNSNDHGQSWSVQTDPLLPSFSNTALAVAFNGEIYVGAYGVLRFDPTPATVNPDISKKFKNPLSIANGRQGSVVEFVASKPTHVRIDIVDELGRISCALCDQDAESRVLKFQLNSKLLSGMYFARAITSFGTYTVKLLNIK